MDVQEESPPDESKTMEETIEPSTDELDNEPTTEEGIGKLSEANEESVSDNEDVPPEDNADLNEDNPSDDNKEFTDDLDREAGFVVSQGGNDLDQSESRQNISPIDVYRMRICELEQDIGFLKQSISSVYDVFRSLNDFILDIDLDSVPDLVYFMERLSEHLKESDKIKNLAEDVELKIQSAIDNVDESNAEREDLERQIYDVVENCDTCQEVVSKINSLVNICKAQKRKAELAAPLNKRMKIGWDENEGGSKLQFDTMPVFPEFKKENDETGGVPNYFGLPTVQGEDGDEVVYTGQDFDMEQYLKQGGVKRKRPTKFHCGACAKVFSKLKYVKSHYQHQHVHQVKLVCNDCGLTFSYKSNLTRHQRLIHMGDRKEKCNECDAAFGTRMQLDSHMRKYHDAPKLSCSDCGQTFIQEQSLRNHGEVCPANDNNVRVMCSICLKSFSAKRYLQNHMRAKHSDRVAKSHVCDICFKSFSGHFALKRHRVKKHKEEVKDLSIQEDMDDDFSLLMNDAIENDGNGSEDAELSVNTPDTSNKLDTSEVGTEREVDEIEESEKPVEESIGTNIAPHKMFELGLGAKDGIPKAGMPKDFNDLRVKLYDNKPFKKKIKEKIENGKSKPKRKSKKKDGKVKEKGDNVNDTAAVSDVGEEKDNPSQDKVSNTETKPNSNEKSENSQDDNEEMVTINVGILQYDDGAIEQQAVSPQKQYQDKSRYPDPGPVLENQNAVSFSKPESQNTGSFNKPENQHAGTFSKPQDTNMLTMESPTGMKREPGFVEGNEMDSKRLNMHSRPVAEGASINSDYFDNFKDIKPSYNMGNVRNIGQFPQDKGEAQASKNFGGYGDYMGMRMGLPADFGRSENNHFMPGSMYNVRPSFAPNSQPNMNPQAYDHMRASLMSGMAGGPGVRPNTGPGFHSSINTMYGQDAMTSSGPQFDPRYNVNAFPNVPPGMNNMYGQFSGAPNPVMNKRQGPPDGM